MSGVFQNSVVFATYIAQQEMDDCRSGSGLQIPTQTVLYLQCPTPSGVGMGSKIMIKPCPTITLSIKASHKVISTDCYPPYLLVRWVFEGCLRKEFLLD